MQVKTFKIDLSARSSSESCEEFLAFLGVMYVVSSSFEKEKNVVFAERLMNIPSCEPGIKTLFRSLSMLERTFLYSTMTRPPSITFWR